MATENTIIRCIIHNTMRLLNFGYDLFRRGKCDRPIKGAFKLVEDSETKGLTKDEASKMLNLSVRQFDRRVAKVLIVKGRKYRGDTRLYWDKDYMDNMSKSLKL